MNGLVGAEVVIFNTTGKYMIWNYIKDNPRFQVNDNEINHYKIVDIGEDMLEIVWLGKPVMKNFPEYKGYISINDIIKIEKL